jgi:hypothetical protein
MKKEKKGALRPRKIERFRLADAHQAPSRESVPMGHEKMSCTMLSYQL